MNNVFDVAFVLILDLEGRDFTDDPLDRGGATKMGITQDRYDEFLESIGEIPRTVRLITEREAKTIYKKFYWDKMKCDDISKIDEKIAIFLFQYFVNCGYFAPKNLQNILGTKDDGIIGKITLGLIKNYNKQQLLIKLQESQLERYIEICEADPSQKKYINGWRNRVKDTLKFLSTI